MIRAASLIQRVGRYLTDFDSTDDAYQHVEWSKQDLLDYFRLAITMVRAADPSSSTCRKELELTGEQLLDLPEGCDDLIKVLGFIDAKGELHTNIKLQKPDADVFVANRPVCAAGRFSPTNFTVSIDAEAGDVITIEPPQTSGKLVLSCSCLPDMEDESAEISMNGKYEPVVFWWMVSMAFGTDIEAAPMRERSDAYWKRGGDILMMLSPKAQVPKRTAA
jgi:hypothetical protein